MNSNRSQVLHCPKCSAAVKAAAHHAGKRLKCPKCSATIKVPGSVNTGNDDDQWFSFEGELPPAAGIPSDESLGDQSRPASPDPNPPVDSVPLGFPDDSSESLSHADIVEPVDEAPSGPALPTGEDEAVTAAIPGRRTARSIADAADEVDDAAEEVASEWMDGLPPVPEEPQHSDSSPDDFTEDEMHALGQFGGFDDDDFGDHASPAVAPGDKPEMLTEADAITEYRAKCPVCDSIHYVKPKMAGKELRCDDCHSQFVVPPPPKVVPKKKVDLEKATTFQLAAASDRRLDETAPGSKSAAEYLRQAEDEYVETEDPAREYETPDVKEWFNENLAIFKDPSIHIYGIGLSLLGAVPAGLVAMLGPFGLPFLFGSGVFAIGYLALLLACAFAIMESNANGSRKVESWPSFDLADWMDNLVVVSCAFVLSLLPGAAFAWMIFGAGYMMLAFSMISLFLCFPFVILSILDNGRVTMPVSSEVSKSVTRCKEAWGSTYITSGILFFVQFLIYVFMSFIESSFAMLFVDCCLTVAFSFIYFALLGRLAFRIGQAINAK